MRKKRSFREPTAVSLSLTALSGVFMGGLLACFLLITQPVVKVSSEPSEERLAKPGDTSVYYLPGKVAMQDSASWNSRIDRFKKAVPGTLPFSEGELNRYFKSFKPVVPAEGESSPNPVFTSPNLNIREESFTLCFTASFNPDADQFDMVVQAVCHFDQVDSKARLVIDSITLNSLPIPSFAGIAGKLLVSKFSEVGMPAEIVNAWRAVRKITLEDDNLLVDIGR